MIGIRFWGILSILIRIKRTVREYRRSVFRTLKVAGSRIRALEVRGQEELH